VTLRLVPPPVLETCRARARQCLERNEGLPRSIAGGIAIALAWVAIITALIVLLVRSADALPGG